MKKLIVSIFAVFLLGAEVVYSAGLLSDVYANRTYDNYRHYSAVNLSPSMTTEIDQLEIGGSYNYLSKIGSDNMYFYALLPIGMRWTVGAAYYSPGMFTQEQIDEDGVRTGEEFTVGERVFAINGAYRFSRFSLGLNLNVNQRKDVGYVEGSGNTVLNKDLGKVNFGVDIGATYFVFESYDKGDLDLGLTVQNVTGPALYKAQDDETAMPNLLLNYRYNFFRRAMTLSGDFSLQSMEDFGMSVDYLYEFPSYVGLGVGYIKGFQSEHFVNVSGELRLQHLINRLSRLQVQIGSGLDSDDFKNLNFTYKVGLMAKLYKTREELNAERMYELAKVAPMKAYNEALEYYKKKMYWKAAFKFGYVIAKYPRFYNVDAASFYMASSFEKLNLNSIALDVYEKSAVKYTTSDWRLKLLIGVQNINYKEGRYSKSNEIYREIEQNYTGNEAMDEAYYIAGNVKSREGDNGAAIRLFSNIDTTSVFWNYAQYSKAISHLAMNDKKEAVKSFKNVTSKALAQADGADVELVNKSQIMLGHTYQEIGNESKDPEAIKLAIASYSSVTSTSVFYDEALLGISWIFIKNRKGSEAMKYIDLLLSMNSPYSAEANLLKGYALSFSGKYSNALKSLDVAISIANKGVTESELSSAKSKRDQERSKMESVGTEAVNFALTKIKLNRDEKTDLMGKRFIETSNKFNEADKVVYDLETKKRFKLNNQTVIDDATYAKGVVSVLVLEEQKQEILQKQKEEAERQQKELEELEKQMNQMNE